MEENKKVIQADILRENSSKTISKERINSEVFQKDMLLEFFEKFNEKVKDIHFFLPLRPKHIASKDSYFEGDFDFLIDKRDFEEILSIIYSLCKDTGINFTLSQRAPHKKLFRFFIEDHKHICLTIELWTSIEYTDKQTKGIFPGQTIRTAIMENKAAEIEILALIYITHLFHKQKDIFSEENLFRFHEFEKSLSMETPKTKRGLEVSAILEGLQKQSFSLLEANNKALILLKTYGIKNRWNGLRRYKRLKSIIKNKFVYLRRVVPVVGPDGVGKGSVSDKCIKSLDHWISFRFKGLYRIKWFYNFRLSLFKNGQERAKNELDEKIGYYIFFTSLVTIRILLFFKPHKILMDRYFMDYFGTPVRYIGEGQFPKKMKLYKFMLFWTPNPEKIVFLGCKDRSLVARKNELSISAVQFLQELNIDFIIKKRPPEVLFISTENDIEVSSLVLCDFLKNMNWKK